MGRGQIINPILLVQRLKHRDSCKICVRNNNLSHNLSLDHLVPGGGATSATCPQPPWSRGHWPSSLGFQEGCLDNSAQVLADCSDLHVGVFNQPGSLFSDWVVDCGGQKVPVSHQDEIKMLPLLLCLLDICTVIKSPGNLGLRFTPKCHANLQKA